MKNSALIRIFSFKRFLRLVMGLLLFSKCLLSADLLDPDEAYVALACYERVPDPMEDRFECGNGTKDDPFVIANLAQLMVLQSNNSLWDSSLWTSDRYFDVVRNLDLGGIPWQPIGNAGTQFKGTFRGLRPNGQPVQIFNLRIDQSTEDNIGFFGYTDRAVIENVGLKNVDVTGNNNVGGLVGFSSGNSAIENSYVTGTVTGNEFVGGLVGTSNTATINNCYATGIIDGVQNIGGLLGGGNGATIENSYSDVDVTGNDFVGGLVGGSGGAIINNCYAAGTIMGARNIGGLLGSGETGTTTINNSYSTVNVTGTANAIGGLVGKSETATNTINNSYATGTVMGSANDLAGLVGYNNNGSTISNSYATGAVTGTAIAIGGLVGNNNTGSTIENSYATGTVMGNSNVGGLVGQHDAGSTINNSYATGTVTGTATAIGGLVGFHSATIIGTNYFVDTVDSNGGADGVGFGTCVTDCLRQTLEQLRGLNEASASAFTSPWPSSSWTRLDEPGFPCIATITFGRGGCPP